MQHVGRHTSMSPMAKPMNGALGASHVLRPNDGYSDNLEHAETVMLSALCEVFDRLEQTGIPYCVLRNRDSIPSSLVRGSDVDIVVPDGTSPQTLTQLFADLSPVQIVKRREVLCFYLPAGQNILKVDFLYRDQEWLGARYQSNEAILRNAWVDRGIPVASRTHQAFFAWFHGLLWGGVSKRRYASVIQDAVRSEPRPFRTLLHSVFGPILGMELWKVAEQGDLVGSEKLTRRVRNSVFRSGLRRHPVSTSVGWIDHFWTEFSLRIRPNGLSVAILGPDGAGKSTICDYLANVEVARFAFSGVTFEHLYHPVLPSPSNLRHFRLSSPSMINTDPHGQPVHGLLLSLLRMTYFTLDQWLSEWIHARRMLARNSLHLHDRHLVEITVDPARYRFGLPAWLVKRLALLAPRPDLIILLDVSPDTLRERKVEVPDAETVRQHIAYRELIAEIGNGFIVNGESPVGQVAEEIRSIVHRETAARTKSRFLRTVQD